MAEGGAGGKEVGRISIRVVPNTDGFREELRAKLEAIEEGLRTKVKVEADTSGVREKIDAVARDAKAKIKVEVDKSDFAKAMSEAKAAAKAAGVKLNIDFRDKEAEAKLAETIAKLKAEAAAAHIKLKLDLDGGGGRRGLLGMLGGGAEAGGGAFGGGAKMGAGMLMDQTAMIVVAVVALIAPALALLATSLAALPALISAVALPIGAIALGKDGIKKALENVGLMGEDKKGKSKPGEQLKELQKGISDEFEKGLTPVFRQLIGLLPTLGEGFKGIAKGLVSLAQGMTDALTSPQGVEAIRGIFHNVGTMLTEMGPGLRDFTTGILNLANVGSTHLPGLAHFMDDLGSRFSNWVTKMSAPGADGGPSTLDKAISGLRPVLDSLFTSLGRLFDAGINMMAKPEMAQNIVKFLDDLTTLILSLLPAAERLFGAVSKLPGFFFSKPGEWNSPFKGDGGGGGKPPGPVPYEKQGLLDQLQTDPGRTAGRGGNWMDQHVGGPLMRFFQGKNQWEQKAQGALPWMDQNVGGPMSRFFQGNNQWEHSLANGAKGLGNAAGGAVDGIVNGAKDLGGKIGGAFGGVEQQASQVWNKIAAAASDAWNKIVESARKAAADVMAEVGKLPGQIAGVFKGAAGALEAAGRDLMNGLKNGIISAGHAAIDAARQVASDVAGAVKGLLGIHSPSTVFHGIGVNTMQGLTNGLDEGGGSAVERAKTLAQSIADAMNNGMGGINTQAVSKQVKDMMAELGIEQDKLRVQADAAPDKGSKKAIRDQMKQIQSVRDQLKLEGDQLGFSTKGGKGGKDGVGSDSMTEAAQYITQGLAKMIDSAKAFAMSNIQQFEGDVGIGGKGAIPVIAEQGIGWLQQMAVKQINGAFGLNDKQGGDTHIHVNSLDDALAVKKNEENKKALQYTRR